MKTRIITMILAMSLLGACKKSEQADPVAGDETDYKAAIVTRTENTAPYTEPENASLHDTISHNTVLKAGKTYHLLNFTYVVNGATLRIEPGVTIVGNKENKGTLIVTRNGRIDAQGTADRPIVFTSAQTSPARGDWGGVILLGNARTNGAYNGTDGLQEIEGGVNNDLGYGLFGGTLENDNSGTMKYVRIEYAGVAFQPNSEINGLTFGSVGSGTTIDYIEVFASGDDSYEWSGGSVCPKHLISVGCTDDDFDCDNGFHGKLQFGIALRDPLQADFATGGTSNGFETDNNASGTTATPQTTAVFSNYTMIGPKANSTTIIAQWGRGAHIRRNSAISLINTVFVGWPTGIRVDGQLSNNALQAGTGILRNVVVVNANTGKSMDTTGGITVNQIDPTAFLQTSGWGNQILNAVSSAMLRNLTLGSTFSPEPMSGSPLLNAAAVATDKTSGMEATTWIGALNAGDTWYARWSRF